MAKRQASDPALFRSVEPLYQAIRAVLESARAGAYRAINTAMVRAYWNVGRLVVEHEQGGAKRAAYGEMVLEGLSRRLTDEFGRGFDVRNLRYMRQFYLTFPISRAPGGKSESAEERNVARSASTASAKRNALRSESPNTLFAEGPGDSRWLVPALRTELSWTLISRSEADASGHRPDGFLCADVRRPRAAHGG